MVISISTLPDVHHMTLLVALDSEEAHYIDPSYGAWETSRERFDEVWYGKTIYFAGEVN